MSKIPELYVLEAGPVAGLRRLLASYEAGRIPAPGEVHAVLDHLLYGLEPVHGQSPALDRLLLTLAEPEPRVEAS